MRNVYLTSDTNPKKLFLLNWVNVINMTKSVTFLHVWGSQHVQSVFEYDYIFLLKGQLFFPWTFKQALHILSCAMHSEGVLLWLASCWLSRATHHKPHRPRRLDVADLSKDKLQSQTTQTTAQLQHACTSFQTLDKQSVLRWFWIAPMLQVEVPQGGSIMHKWSPLWQALLLWHSAEVATGCICVTVWPGLVLLSQKLSPRGQSLSQARNKTPSLKGDWRTVWSYRWRTWSPLSSPVVGEKSPPAGSVYHCQQDWWGWGMWCLEHREGCMCNISLRCL